MVDGRHDDYSSISYWDRLIQHGPAAALVTAQRVLGGPNFSENARTLAHGAAGRSLFELGRVEEAVSVARRGLESSVGATPAVRAWIAMTASFLLAEAGQIDEALDSLSALADGVEGVERARIRLQVAYVLHHAGRLNESLAEFDRSERLLDAASDPEVRTRIHLNRGLVLLQQGRLQPAAADFAAAEDLAAQLGMTVVQAQTVANRAVLLGRARRLAESLEEFERARMLFEAAGNPHRPVAIMSIDRAEVMLHSGLLADAVLAGRAAVASVEPSGNVILVGDALLVAARAELAAGQTHRAIASARRAEATFETSGRVNMVPHARAIVVQAGLIGTRDETEARGLIAEAADVIFALRSAGWSDHADELAIFRVRAGRRFGLTAEISDDVERLRVGDRDGRRDTALSGAWAEAVRLVAAGQSAAAIDACGRGLDVLDDIVAEAASLAARSAAMRLGNDLSELLIEIAVDRGDADTVLAAAEGTRARALHNELATTDRHRPLTSDGAARLRHELGVRLVDRTLVEWIVVRDRVWAVVFDASESRLVEVGSREDILRSRDRVRMWLDLAAAEPDGSSLRARAAAASLDDLLLRPLKLPDSEGLVNVPTDLLHGIPWSGMPSLAGRPFSLAPNAQVWLEADRRSGRGVRSVGLVVGPGVVGSDIERRAVEHVHPAVAVAAGQGATASTLRSMLAGSDLVHIAAHGTFRSDHPLLSTLRLHDGEATLYEALPDRVDTMLTVLSSCEGGAQGTTDGSEVLGLSAVLLARGAAAVVAPLTVVRELECADFLAEVHEELANGEPIACAVAEVRRRWLDDDDLSRWAVASSFVCFGSGRVTLAPH